MWNIIIVERKLGLSLVDLSLNIGSVVGKPIRPYGRIFLICQIEPRPHSPVFW